MSLMDAQVRTTGLRRREVYVSAGKREKKLNGVGECERAAEEEAADCQVRGPWTGDRVTMERVLRGAGGSGGWAQWEGRKGRVGHGKERRHRRLRRAVARP